MLLRQKEYPEYSILKNYRESLLQNHHTIEVTDFGAGSKSSNPTHARFQESQNLRALRQKGRIAFSDRELFQT
jgi:hypothetical protein